MATDEGTAGEPSYFRAPARDPPGGDEPPGGRYPRDNPGGNPGGDPNPMPGGPPGGGGGGLPEDTPLAGRPLEREGGALTGQPPAIFRGDRAQTMKFMQQFTLWKRLNSNKTVMRIAGQRVALALTLMEGERVDNWVMQQTDKLVARVDGIGRRRATHDEDDEDLWDDFASDFLLAFTHTASKEEAYAKLTQLTMKGFLVDEYISAYEILVQQADWNRESAGAVVLFKDGLPAWLCRRIMMRDNTPLGIRGWQEAVRDEVRREIEIQNTLGSRQGRIKGTTRQNRYLSGALQTPTHSKKKDPDAMDVDVNVVKTSQMSKEEKAKLFQEKRCFYCKEEGHQARSCPKKSKRKEKEKGKQPAKSRTAQIEVVDDREEKEDEEEGPSSPPPAYDTITAVVRRVKTLSAEERETLMDQLADKDFV